MITGQAVIHVGYWIDTHHLSFVPNGRDPRNFVDPMWDATERARVVAHLRNGREHATWRGFSYCRFECGRPSHKMGSRDLTDGVYMWPEGYVHYIEDHNVKPPAEFIAHVLGWAKP